MCTVARLLFKVSILWGCFLSRHLLAGVPNDRYPQTIFGRFGECIIPFIEDFTPGFHHSFSEWSFGCRSYTYVDLGDSTQRCRYCGASFWYGERLKGRSHGQRVEYHLCCSEWMIYMQHPPEPPEYIKQLFQNKHFMENIRAYNQMFAMTSFGAKIDESINAGKGPYVFKVSGQVYHWIGS
ncbi:hypothetical protein Tco_1063053, partial [Tanacetum coccineum]